MNKYLVVGGSGTVGSQVVSLLKEQGLTVRTTTGKKAQAGTKDGVERVYVNLQTGEGIQEAFTGITQAFLLSPSGYANQQAVLSPLIREAKRQGLKKVVLMTAFGANAVETTPMRQAEIELEQSGLAYNIIRPNWFMQNFNTFWVQGIKEQGKILLPAAKAKVSFIDARDIAAVAAKLLTTDTQLNRAFDLTGPASLDHSQVAAALAKATGKSISYQEIPPAQLKQGLLGAGLPEDYSDFLLFLFSVIRDGYSAPVTGAVQTLLGRAPIGIEQYAADHKAAF